jgi:hypothetical protein
MPGLPDGAEEDRLLPDGLWRRIQPLPPPPPPRPRGGVPRRVPHRNGVAGLIFMARTSTPRAPVARQGAGLWLGHDLLAAAGRVGQGRVFDQLQQQLLDELGAAGRIGLERVSVDSFSLRAVKGGT